MVRPGRRKPRHMPRKLARRWGVPKNINIHGVLVWQLFKEEPVLSYVSLLVTI